MRQGNSGKWWASAGCAGLVIASAFIGLTLYLGSPGFRQEALNGGLAGGPDPVTGSPGPSLVRRKGSPLWPSTVRNTRFRAEETAWEDLEEITIPSVTTASTATTTSTSTSTTTTSTSASTSVATQPSTVSPSTASTTKKVLQRYRATKEPSSRAVDIDWDEILHNVNRSLNPRLSQRLNELAEIDPAALIKNTSSLVSFGLLAVDLFLLHNVQRIAFTENAGKQLSEDPEVVALNSLFDGSGERRQRGGGVFGEMLGFVQGAVRGVVNLGRAYRRAHRARSTGPTPLDCIWTLYCRNLDKTAKLGGPYGLLAKMNSLGLRLMLGEFAPEAALERLMSEISTGGGRLDCDSLFPREELALTKRYTMSVGSSSLLIYSGNASRIACPGAELKKRNGWLRPQPKATEESSSNALP